MTIRERLEGEEQRLAPYAVRAASSRGRRYPDSPHPYRTVFQRDRDKVVHTPAFRRLAYKTQVFLNFEGDTYRTRLTHTLEATQIARTIARALRLNEDLTEAISLAHDLGHPPFGHAGEEALDALVREAGDDQGFEHNWHSLRLVDELEGRHPAYRGLNLTWEVREGITKHRFPVDEESLAIFEATSYPSLEAQVADIADEIAYCNHDVEDGLRSGMLTSSSLESVELWREALKSVLEIDQVKDEDILNSRTISFMISSLTKNLIRTTFDRLMENSIGSPEDGRKCRVKCVSFDSVLAGRKRELKEFLLREMYGNYRVIRMEEKARRIIGDLFGAYCNRPEQLPPHIFSRVKTEGIKRVVCDYIAGMTDRYAMEEYRKLFDPLARV